MIKAYITKLNADIAELDMVDRWGQFCETKLHEGLEIGINKDPSSDCHGNTYTPEDNYKSVGFCFIDTWEMKPSSDYPKANELDVTFGISIFYNPEKLGENMNYMEAGINFINELNKIVDTQGKRYGFSGRASRVLEKFTHVRLLYTKKFIVPCDFTFSPLTAIGC